jgi:4-hydroxybenzoate polyprenyltransferase
VIVPLVTALRPKQWVKNSFCLAPLIFSRRALDLDAVIDAAVVFVAFSLVASTIYLINDIADRDHDRAHPKKRLRPIAAGLVGVPLAVVSAAAIGAGSLAIGYRQGYEVLAVLATYLVLNLGYSLWLKHLVLVDLFVISIGFVLRVIAGAAAIGVASSAWILTCTLFLSLLLAACKRRAEVAAQGPEAGTRKVLAAYSLQYLDLIISVVAAGAVLSYALYTLSPATVAHLGTSNLIYTLPFAVFAVFRYIWLVLQRAQGESPFELLMRDPTMLINIAGYLAVTLTVVYVL